MKKFSRTSRKAKLDDKILHCRKCEGLNLPEDTMSAPGYGNLKANIMFIGQSLHSYNSETPVQIPFRGPSWVQDSGDILESALKVSGVKFEDVFLTNVVHCHPPYNRMSTPVEVKNCLPYLIREILLVKPRLLVCLGNSAGQALNIPARERIRPVQIKTKKRAHSCYGVLVFHPAYIMRKIETEPDKREEILDAYSAYFGYLFDTFGR